MFRKLQDRLSAAVFGGGSAAESDVERLQALGFSEPQATAALEAAGHNVDRAAELLLSSSSSSQQPQSQLHSQNHDHDAELQRVLQQSMMEQQQQQQQLTVQQHRTEVMSKAAEAAARRAAQAPTKKKSATKTTTAAPKPPPRPVPAASQLHTAFQATSITTATKTTAALSQHHPDVKIIPKLQDKSVEEQVLRTADRMKHHPAAVDTLYRLVSTIYKEPANDKYRRIDTTTAAYQRSGVQDVPGAHDFLMALKFQTMQNVMILHTHLYDPALVYLGMTALEQTKRTAEYTAAKAQLLFVKEMQSILNTTTTTDTTEQETAQRAAFLAQCPKEPVDRGGGVALVKVQLLPNVTLHRRFDSDDTVHDVLTWLGGTVGSALYQRLVVTGTWCLVDMNSHGRATTVAGHHHHHPTIDCVNGSHLTLQYVGCWPSGRLQVRPSATTIVNDSNNSNSNMDRVGETKSRGLALGSFSDDE
jgi:PUB domain/UBA/TS-N domain